MCRRTIQTALALSLGMAVSASAGPILLGSVHLGSGMGSNSKAEDNVVQFSFHVADGPEYLPPGTGQGIFWGDGASGVMDFDASNDPAFLFVAAQLTDGHDDSVYYLARVPGLGGGGGGKEESRLFDRNVLDPLVPPDLIGFEVNFLRLIVDSVEFERMEVEPGIFIDMTYEITWEIYGTQIIPEPSSFALLFLFGLLVFLREKKIPDNLFRNPFVRFSHLVSVAIAIPLLNPAGSRFVLSVNRSLV